jgi:tartrate dehydrogenase/decarboxylase/D-malate dehydrogenase
LSVPPSIDKGANALRQLRKLPFTVPERRRQAKVKTYRIATIPGDGIGKEVVPAGRRVLQALAAANESFAFEFEDFDWGGDYFRSHGVMMPDDGLDALRGKDAILFGSAGDPDIPDHVTLWGLRLKICQGLDQYANVRPTRILPGIDAPLKHCRAEDLNWVIVRENSEGEYSGVGGRVHQGHPIEVATDVSIMTRVGVERILRFAFRLAQSRPRKLLTVITKSNAQRHAMVMWDEIAVAVAEEFPDVTWDKELVDAATVRMVNRPASLDTIVATNLHADILSDLAAALAGSLGIAPTGNIDPERRYPSMFEPIHGSAFDIMGKGLANPIGTFWSVVMLLEHLGEPAAAGRVMRAIEHVTADPALHTQDLGGAATTAQVTEAVCAELTKPEVQITKK